MNEFVLWEEPLIGTVEGKPSAISVEIAEGRPFLRTDRPVPPGAKPNLKLLAEFLRTDTPVPSRMRQWLADLMDANATTPLHFKALTRRKRGAHIAGRSWHMEAALQVEAEIAETVKFEAAVAAAMQTYKISRTTVTDAYRQLQQVRTMERIERKAD